MTEFSDTYGTAETDEAKFLVMKLNRVFEMMDFEKKGTIFAQDFVEWGRRAAAIGGVKFTRDMEETWIKTWEAYFGDGNESKDAWIRKAFAFKNMAKEKTIEMSVEINIPLFDCVDLDGNGEISYREFNAMVMPLGVSENDAKVAFDIIDTDKNGVLDKSEFAEAMSNYYLTAVPNRFQHLFGFWDVTLPAKIVKVKKASSDERLGIALNSINDEIRVASLDSWSPLLATALKEGDKIIAINGKEISGCPASYAASILRNSTGEIEMLVSYDDDDEEAGKLSTTEEESASLLTDEDKGNTIYVETAATTSPVLDKVILLVQVGVGATLLMFIAHKM
jgi:hypothetical protein